MKEEAKSLEPPQEQLPLGEEVTRELDRLHKIYLQYYAKDSALDRRDSAEVVVDLLAKTREALQKVVSAGEEAREKLFWVLFNGSIQLFTYCRTLREASHSHKAIEGLVFAISILDGNLILMKSKYLQWRVRVYSELAGIYEDLGAPAAAKNVVTRGQSQVQYLEELEEQDPPVPESTAVAIVEARRVLNALELKYALQAGQLKPDAWKKKLEEYYAENKPALGVAIVESLTSSVKKAASLIAYEKEDLPEWKAGAVEIAVNMLEPDIETVTKALQEQVEQKEREKTKQEEIDKAAADLAQAAKAAKEAELAAELEAKAEEEKRKESKKEGKKEGKAERKPEKKEAKGKAKEEKEELPTVDSIVEKYKQLDSSMVKEKVWKEASRNVPFEIHVELIKLCFQIRLWERLDKLVESAYIRLRYRRIEVPFVTGVDILASIQKDPNVPNGYDMLPADINALHLKQELIKLRASQKSKLMPGEGAEHEATTTTAKADKKKKTEEGKKPPEEKKKEDKKKPAKKEEKKKKAEKKEGKDAEKKPSEEKKEIATEWELSQIKHTYVRLIVERSRAPVNAVCGLTVTFADPQSGAEVSGKETAVVIPLQGNEDDSSTLNAIPSRLPFIVFKRTSNALKDEDEQLSLITDVQCLVSKDPYLLPPVGYVKIPIDLRENPTELVGLGTREYIYLAYKTERDFRLAERDIEIVKNLLELERSCLQPDNEEYDKLSKGKKDLGLTFDLSQLSLLGNIVRDAIMGPIGDVYLSERQDMLFDIVSLLWRKFVEPVLKAVDYTDELDAHGELLDYFAADIKLVAAEAVKVMAGIVLTSHRILNKLRLVDPVLYGQIALQAGELYERLHDYRISIQVLRAGMSRMGEFREGTMKMGADGSENWVSPMYITCNNYFIDTIEKRMAKALEDWTDNVLREERQRGRKAGHKPLLEPDEADHEFYEIKGLSSARTAAGEDEESEEQKRGKELLGEVEKHRKRYYSDLEGLLASLHCDMVVCLYRTELKLGRAMEGVKNQTTKTLAEHGIEAPDITKGVSTGLKAKMTIGNGATAKKIKHDQKYLETTLHEAGKLPPPKPPLQSYEVVLQKEANKNPYLNALINMELAVHKTSAPEQQFLLLEAIKFANLCEETEKTLGELMVGNSVYVKAARMVQYYKGKTILDAYPFFYLKAYTPKSKVPLKPVLISRASTSISFMMPFFRPLGKGANVKDTALYGKVSVSGVGVSLNNTDYEGTGTRVPFGSVLTVPGLLPHDKYVFGAAAFCDDGSCPHGIGETSDEFVALVPMSVPQIYSYLADVAYKLGVYDIAKDAAERLCMKVIEKNELRCNVLDSRINPILAYSLNKEYINLLPVTDVRHIANAFLVLGKSLCHLRNKRMEMAKAKGIVPSLVQLDDQKAALRVCSYLVIGIEAAAKIKDHYLTKLLVIQIYNTLVDFFQSQTQSPLLLHALVKCHVALTLIPANCLDGATRAVGSCISYQIALATVQVNEAALLHAVVNNDLVVMRRRWLTSTRTRVVPPVLLSEEELKTKEEQDKTIAEGGSVPEEELVKVPEAREETVVEVYEGEKEGEAVEEFFMTLGEYNERIAQNANKWKTLLGEYVQVATDGENVVNALTGKIDAVVQFWQNMASDPGAALDEIVNTGKQDNPRYLEFACKCIRRMLESDGWTEENDLVARLDSVEIDEEDKKEIDTSLESQSKELQNDVLERAVKRLQILDQVCAAAESGEPKESIKGKVVKALARNHSDDPSLRAVREGTITSPQKLAADSGEIKKERLKWLAELHYLQGSILFEKFKKQYQGGKCKVNANYFDIKQLDFERMKALLEDDDARQGKKEQSEEDTLLKEIVEAHARGCLYALSSGAKLVMHNIIVQLWNFLLHLQASPAIHKRLASWPQIVIISYCIVTMLAGEEKKEKRVRFKGETKEGQECTVLYANVISYSVQCLLMVEKWLSLADLCQRFNGRTKNEYGGFLLPFAIYAQTVLYTRSDQATNSKREELKARIEAFEKWSATKKKKSRAAMITGEIPPEEQEFIKDRTRLQAEIVRLETIQDFAFEDKHKSEETLALVKRDSSTAKEALTNCRKGLIDYAQKTCEILAEQRAKGSASSDVKRLLKVHLLITNKVVGAYKKTIEVLRERQENFMLVQALHELGNIYFAEQQLKEAEIQWSDSLDTVYQELYALTNFRAVVKKVPNLVAKFGMKPCLTSLVLLSKLHKFAYGGDLQKLGQTVDMALHVAFEPFKLTMPHPQQFSLFATYKCTELLPKVALFDDNFELSGADLLQALDYITTLGIDYEEYERNLPALALMQMVARNVCYSNEYLIRARVKLAISLSHIGYMQEALVWYHTLVDRKDLVEIGARTSLQHESSKGISSTKYETLYHNGLPPYEEPNKKTLAELSAAEIDKTWFSTFNLALIRFARCVILFRAYEAECVDGPSSGERQEERTKVLKRVEDELRDVLKTAGRLEEVVQLKHIIESEELRADSAGKANEGLEEKKNALKRVVEEEGVDISVDGEKEFVDVKNDIFTLMVHARLLIGRVLQVQGLYIDSYNVLNTGVMNLRRYCLGLTKAETSVDAKSEVAMIPEGIIAGVGTTGKDKKGTAAAGKEEKKKAGAGDKKKQAAAAAVEASKEEESKMAADKIAEELKAAELNKTTQSKSHINAFLWFRLRVELMQTMYLQAKYEDCEVLAKSLLEESEKVKDVYFRRLIQQVQCYIQICKGKYEEGERIFDEIIKHAKHFGQADIRLAMFMGNMAELIFRAKGEPKKAGEILKEARIIMWQLLKNYGLEIEAVDINKNSDKSGVFIDSEGHLKEDEYFQDGEKAAPELVAGPQESTFDYSAELTADKLRLPDKTKNSSFVSPNVYLQFLEQLIKVDLRYARVAMADGNYDTAIRVLNDTLALTKRTLNLHPVHTFMALLMSAIANKQLFKEQINAYSKTYVAKSKSSKKYESFAKLQPHGSENPLGVEVFKLPMFGHKLATEFWKLVAKAYEDIRAATLIISEESVLLSDFDEKFNSRRAFYECADICRLMAEYAPRPNYLFFDYAQHRKEEIKKGQPKLSDEDVEKLVKEDLAKSNTEFELRRGNYFSESIQALEQAIKCDTIQKSLLDGYPELAQTTLIDPSRAPKDVIKEIFEADFHAKKTYKDLPSIETKPKTALASADVLAYCISLSNELKIFTFGKEFQTRRMSKLHRYLKTNLSTYSSQCCISYKPYECVESAEELYSPTPSSVLSIWTPDPYSRKDTQIYVIGPREGVEGEKATIGFIVVDAAELGKLYQELQNLLRSFTESSEKSEDVFARDKEQSRPTYVSLVRKVGDLFAPRTATDEAKALVEKVTPEFTAENLKALVDYVSMYGVNVEHKELCAMIRLFHCIRYKLALPSII